MSGWRVWFAFEERPGVMTGSLLDMERHWRALLVACKKPDGKNDSAEFDKWMTIMVEYSHLWGHA